MNLETLLDSVGKKMATIDLDIVATQQNFKSNQEIDNRSVKQQVTSKQSSDFSEVIELTKRIKPAMRDIRVRQFDQYLQYYKGKDSFSASELASTCTRKSLLLRLYDSIPNISFNVEYETNYPQLDLVCKVGDSVHEYFQKHLLENIYDELIDFEIELPSRSLKNMSKSRYDGYCKYDGKYVLVDIKTTKPSMVDTVKPEHIYQLHYYYYVLTTDYHKQVDELHILNVSRDLEQYKVFNITINKEVITTLLGKLKLLQQNMVSKTIPALSEVPAKEKEFCRFCGFYEFCNENQENIMLQKESRNEKDSSSYNQGIEILL